MFPFAFTGLPIILGERTSDRGMSCILLPLVTLINNYLSYVLMEDDY